MWGAGGKFDTAIRFGIFELDIRAGELRKRGLKSSLSHQSFCVLLALLKSPGDIVTRSELRTILWPDGTFLDFDSAINKLISEIRTNLGDNGPSPRFIETVRKRGYRFIAPVTKGFAAEGRRVRSVAVLPFENLTGDPGLAYIADGITEACTAGLSGLNQLLVVSRTSAKAISTPGKSVAAIGRELDAGFVVEGSVIRFSDNIRLSARLVDTKTERVLWQSQFDSELMKLLAVCDRLTRELAGELTGTTRSPQAFGSQLCNAQTAFLTYLKGRYLWSRRTEKDLYRAIDAFQQAIDTDESLALAHTGLADCHSLLGIWGFEPSHTAFRIARRAALRALQLDENLAEAHASLAEVLKDYDWDWAAAESEILKSISLNPNYSFARHAYSQLLVTLGRHAEAAEQIEYARRADPLSPAINAYAPYIYLAGRDYKRAIGEGENATELEPSSPLARVQLGRAYLFQGDIPRALAELEKASDLANGRPMWRAELCFARARAGDEGAAEKILDEVTGLAQQSYVSPYDLAICHAGLGHKESALRLLETAFADRVMRIITIGDPELDCLRTEPRFGCLMSALRLPRSYS